MPDHEIKHPAVGSDREPGNEAAPRSPTELPKQSWWGVLKRTVKEDHLADWAAALAGVIVFLIWLWISNIAVLLGVEFDAELARGRAIEAGRPEDREPYVEPRDTRKFDKR